MAEFQFDELCHDGDNRKLKDECIIALKVYDQCRQQDCLTPDIIGPARFAGSTPATLGIPGRPDVEVILNPGDPIDPPSFTAGVTILPDTVTIGNILIARKVPNPLRPGYYDIDLKISIRYTLRLFDAAGIPVLLNPGTASATPNIPGENIFNKKVTLFGSIGSDVSIATDIFPIPTGLIQTAPFVFVEAKAVALDAKLRYVTPFRDIVPPPTQPLDKPPTPNAINVTLGLFVIIKLFRPVQLKVESKGFCEPAPCPAISPDACEFFNNLDFPFDVFNPPQKDEFSRRD